MNLATNNYHISKIVFFIFIIMAGGLASCSLSTKSEVAPYVNSTWTKIINNLIDESILEEGTHLEDDSLEDLDKMFDDLDLIELENENWEESSAGDYWANLSKIIYWGSSFWWKEVDILYSVTWFIPNSSETMSYNGSSYLKWIISWDFMKEFAIMFNDISFDSISYKTNSVENISIEYGQSNQRWIEFTLFFDNESADVRSSKLRKIFQRDAIFDVVFAYLVNKLNWPTIKVSSNFQQFANEGDSFVFKWECLERDWTWDSGNFRDIREIFAKWKYANSTSWYVLDKYWKCISWINWKCEAWSDSVDSSNFDNWVLLWWKKYLKWDVSSINFPWSWALCALYDDFDKTNTVPTFCWAWDKWLWSADTRWRVVFRPKKNSFCVVAGTSVESESNYPKVACNITSTKDDTFDYYNGSWNSVTQDTDIACWNDKDLQWASEYVWTWKPRDCIVEDFQCKWAETECWPDWQCWWWCWGWNKEVNLRKDVECYFAEWPWKEARLAARDLCDDGNYTLTQQASVWTHYCGHTNPTGVYCDTEPDPSLVLWCYCNVATNQWKEPACVTPFVEWVGGWCIPWSIRYTSTDCSSWVKKQSCSDSKVWVSISWAKWACAKSCTSTEAIASHIVSSDPPYELDLDIWEKIFFKDNKQDSLDLCRLWNRAVKRCTQKDWSNWAWEYLWLVTDDADIDKQLSYTEDSCNVSCKIYEWWNANPMDEFWEIDDGTWVTIDVYSSYLTWFQNTCASLKYDSWTLTCKTWDFYQWEHIRWSEMFKDCFDCKNWINIPSSIATYWNPTTQEQDWVYDVEWILPCSWKCDTWYHWTWTWEEGVVGCEAD